MDLKNWKKAGVRNHEAVISTNVHEHPSVSVWCLSAVCEVYHLCILYECGREFTTGQDPEQAGGGGCSGEIVFEASRQRKLVEASTKDVHYLLAVCYSYIYIHRKFSPGPISRKASLQRFLA
jgi:hypothetical protein